MTKRKIYKSVLGLVWGLSSSWKFRIHFTWIIFKQKLYNIFKKEE